MISSGALPKVTFSSPPSPGPDLAASSSAATPIRASRSGMTPRAAVTKTKIGSRSKKTFSAIAIGMKGARK